MSVTGILGKKIGMTLLFDDKGEVHPVTGLQGSPGLHEHQVVSAFRKSHRNERLQFNRFDAHHVIQPHADARLVNAHLSVVRARGTDQHPAAVEDLQQEHADEATSSEQSPKPGDGGCSRGVRIKAVILGKEL